MLPMLLKAVAFPSRLHSHHSHFHPLSSPFVYGGKRQPPRPPHKRGHDTILLLALAPRRPLAGIRFVARSNILVIPQGRKSSSVSLEGYCWRMRSESVMASMGSRKWSTGAAERGGDRGNIGLAGDDHDEARREAMGVSQDGEVEVGTNGGCGQQEEKNLPRSGLLTLPTALTLARVAAIPLLVSTFYMNGSLATTATTSIFIAAAITDWLDGYIARKMQMRTTFGAFLDPVADKLMIATTLILLCTRPSEAAIFVQAPWLLTIPSIAIIGREITMSAVREWAASQDGKVLEAVAVNNLGKWKTATQMAALTILLVTRDPSLTGADGLIASGVVLLHIAAGLAVWSLVVYMKKIWRILLK